VLDSYRADKAQERFTRFARAKIWHCPTLVALEKLALDHPELDADDKRLNAKRFERELEVVHAMNAAGVPLLVGTDTPYANRSRRSTNRVCLRLAVDATEMHMHYECENERARLQPHDIHAVSAVRA